MRSLICEAAGEMRSLICEAAGRMRSLYFLFGSCRVWHEQMDWERGREGHGALDE